MNKLQEYRKLKGLSQSQLAKESGVPLKTIQKYESGERSLTKASVESVLALARCLDITVEKLVG